MTRWLRQLWDDFVEAACLKPRFTRQWRDEKSWYVWYRRGAYSELLGVAEDEAGEADLIRAYKAFRGMK